jgi:hypothetical protein
MLFNHQGIIGTLRPTCGRHERERVVGGRLRGAKNDAAAALDPGMGAKVGNGGCDTNHQSPWLTQRGEDDDERHRLFEARSAKPRPDTGDGPRHRVGK